MVMRAQYNLKLEVQKRKKQGLENQRESMEVKRQSSNKRAKAELPNLKYKLGEEKGTTIKIQIQNTSVLFLDKQQIFCCVDKPWSPDFCTASRK
jgi:hypothetical protein